MVKIGILIKEFDTLHNWELRIIKNIENNPNLELTLLIKDGREKKDHKISKNSFSNFLFNKQVLFEKNRYLKNLQTVNKKEIIRYLNTIPAIESKPKQEDDLDIFSDANCQKVKEYNLDIIIKHEFNIVSGEILNAAKYGIWLLIHGNNLKKTGPPGFWEILTKQPVVEVCLIQVTSKRREGYIIDKAYFNRHNFSYVETNIKILESSVSLLFKNIKKIELECFSVSKSVCIYNSDASTPTLVDTLKYSLKYSKDFLRGFLQRIFGSFGKHSNHWTLFIGKGNFLDSDLSKLKPLKVPNDEFWADPFLFRCQNQFYVFFENYSYKTKRGKISCGRVENNILVEIIDVLDLNYHLSYPFIFEEEGEIFMMPETGQNKRLEIYKCVNFPDKWELYTTAFEGENIADAFFYNDNQKQKWLFLNKIIAPNTDRTSELYIYKVDSLKLKSIEPHKQNPVIIDSRVARNGGAIFEFQDKMYRPSQSNSDGVYGKGLNINQINKLSINEYVEKTIRKVEPDFQKGLVSIHHLHQIDGIFVFDAAFK